MKSVKYYVGAGCERPIQPAPRSVPAPRPPAPRSAPSFFSHARSTLRSAPPDFRVAPLRFPLCSRSAHMLCRLPLLTPPTKGFSWNDLRKILPGCQWMTKVPNGVVILPKFLIVWVGRTNVTDNRRKDNDIAYNTFTLANNKVETHQEMRERTWTFFTTTCTRTKNTIDSCINSATDRFLQRRFTKFSENTQCNGHYAVQGHSRSPILVPIESSYTTSY